MTTWDDNDDDDEEDWKDDKELAYYPCPECGEDVYEEAEQCPYCGMYIVDANRRTLGTVFFWTAILLLILFGLSYLAAAL